MWYWHKDNQKDQWNKSNQGWIHVYMDTFSVMKMALECGEGKGGLLS